MSSPPFPFFYITQLNHVIDTFQTQLKGKNKEMIDWKVKYNIKTAEEAEAIRKQQMVKA